MKKLLVIPALLAITFLTTGASGVGFKLFDVNVEKGTLKELAKPAYERHKLPSTVAEKRTLDSSEPDIAVESVNGIYIFKINTKKLVGEIKPHYLVHLQTNKEVFDETGARLVINAGFFDPKNEQTVSYLTLNGKVILDPNNNKNLVNNKHLKPYMSKILNRSEFRVLKADGTGELKYDIAPHNDPFPSGYSILHAVQGGPGLAPRLRLEEEFFVLTDNKGKVISQSASSLAKYPRTIIGIKDNDVYFLIATTENPITLPEASDLVKKAGFEKAMAFDGGGSVSVDFRDKDLHIISDKDNTARKLKSFIIVTGNNTSETSAEYQLLENKSQTTTTETVLIDGVPVPRVQPDVPDVMLKPTAK